MLSRYSWVSIVVLAAAAAACHPRPPATAPSRTTPARPAAPVTPPAPPPPAPMARPTAAPLSEAELFRRKSLAELNGEHPLSDVFFDLDQDTLRPDGVRVLQQDAQWLARWPQVGIRIDGHCDERGTAEYNIALGDRRVRVIREYLANLGVRADRVEVRSLGREAPFCREDTETCWAQNRRGHFEITAK